MVWHSHIGDPPSEQPLSHAPRTGQHAVLLEEHGGERVLPMWIGPAEAHGLTLGLSGRSEPRPLTWDLTARLLQAGGLRLERVVVEGFRDFTFYATVVLRSDGESHEIDARPSDAFNLAIRMDAPVFVATELIEQSGAPLAHMPLAGTEWKAPAGMKPGAQPIGQWRSVLAEAGSRIGGLVRGAQLRYLIRFSALTVTRGRK